MRISLLIIVLIIASITMNGQDDNTHHFIHPDMFNDHRGLPERVTANREYHAENPGLMNRRDPIYVPVKFHMLADFQGEGRVKYSLVLESLCLLNEFYNQFEIYFYLHNDGTEENPEYFNLLDNTGAFEDPRRPSSVTYLLENKSGEAADVFIVENAGSSGATVSAGFYSGGGDYIVLDKGNVAGDNILTHEIGHFLSLPHPHTGWEDTGWGNADPSVYNPVYPWGTTVTVNSVSSSQSGIVTVELQNGSNCDVAGDRICDTSPNYGFGIHVSGCNFNRDVFDRNGDKVVPNENNLMSYFSNCDFELTPGQVEAVEADYFSPGRAFLRNNYVPEIIEPVTVTPTNISPAFGANVEFFNAVQLTWDPVPNATGYLLEFSSGVQENSYITYTPDILIEDLEPNTSYIYSLVPFNEISACAEAASSFLSTGSGTTSTNEIDEIASFRIYPNPATDQNQVRFALESDENMNGQLSIFDITGRELIRKTVGISAGSNIYKIDDHVIGGGVYLIKLSTEKGILTDSFIIN